MPYVSVGFDFMCEFRPKTKTSTKLQIFWNTVISFSDFKIAAVRKMIKFYFEVFC